MHSGLKLARICWIREERHWIGIAASSGVAASQLDLNPGSQARLQSKNWNLERFELLGNTWSSMCPISGLLQAGRLKLVVGLPECVFTILEVHAHGLRQITEELRDT